MNKAAVLVICYLMCQYLLNAEDTIPEKGTVFNESEWQTDSITGRKLLKLTRNRNFNQTPTYHINTGFSNDSKWFVFATWNKGGESAIILADTQTGDLKVLAKRSKIEKAHFNGNNLCILPAVFKAAASVGGKLYLFDLKTLSEKVMFDAGEGNTLGHPTGTPDGKTVFVTVMPKFNAQTDDPFKAASSSIISVNIETGEQKKIFSDKSRSNHSIVCPSNPDLLLIDRDLPPKYGSGSDNGKTSRVWILNTRTQQLTEIRPNNKNRFQIHSNWSHDGLYLYYHGVSKQHNYPDGFNGKPHYIGVADQNGKIIWESVFPNFFYGHICTHTGRNSIITDGLFFNQLITEIDWSNAGTTGIPELKILGAHNSGSHSFGQHAHPHCLMSPDSKKISFNKGTQSNSNVYILNLE